MRKLFTVLASSIILLPSLLQAQSLDTVVVKKLKAGWNLVGYMGQTPEETKAAFASIMDKVEMIKTLDGFYTPEQQDYLNSLQTINPLDGLMIKVSEGCVLERTIKKSAILYIDGGSGTKVTAGTNVTVTGAGTATSPYVINSNQAPGTAAGQMQYWNGTDWVIVAATTNEGATLQMIGGVPTWTGGIPSVINTITGKIWMDRNLGASQVATSSTDANSLYQWGRATDGHQLRTSGKTTTVATTNTPGHGNFITNSYDSPFDWRNPQNDNLWQGVNGINNPCPKGYRLPTVAEWEAERTSWSSNNAAGAFASPLKLPAAGGRSYTNGSLGSLGSGLYWSSTVDGTNSRRLQFDNSDATTVYSFLRATGYPVRCIKD